MGLWRSHPLIVWWSWHLLGWPHVGPDDARLLIGRIGLDRYTQTKLRIRRFGGHVDTSTLHVKLPAVIHTTQSALFVSPIEEWRATVCTVGFNETNLTR